MTRSHVTAAVWGCDFNFSFSTPFNQTLLNKDRQCCESWRDAELGVRAVCAVDGTKDEYANSSICNCTRIESVLDPPILTKFRTISALSTQNFVRTLSTLIRGVGVKEALRRQQSVPSVSSTTQLSQCICCSALAACR